MTKTSAAFLFGIHVLMKTTSSFTSVSPVKRPWATGVIPNSVGWISGKAPEGLKVNVDGENEKVEGFENDGMFSWMIPFMDMMGMVDGKVLKYGLLTTDPPETSSWTPQDMAGLHNEAREKMTNIGIKERQRRDQIGNILIPLTVAYATLVCLFLDDGSLVGTLTRFGIVLPLFFARGYKLSAQTGLCNIAQKGLWDVDDTGLKIIEDPSLAQRFVERVNALNLNTGFQAVGVATIFAALPHSVTKALALVVAFSTVLYLLKDKVPSEVK